ncbi:MAG: hypothetical protein AB7I27_12390 [Bacteriovoracaceae bacterium]
MKSLLILSALTFICTQQASARLPMLINQPKCAVKISEELEANLKSRLSSVLKPKGYFIDQASSTYELVLTQWGAAGAGEAEFASKMDAASATLELRDVRRTPAKVLSRANAETRSGVFFSTSGEEAILKAASRLATCGSLSK